MLKFRTMPINAETASGPVWTRQGERRATPIGALLRRTSLDELPQFINVLKGEMSLVGPRPERPEFVKRFRQQIPGYMQKHLVKAGITGWAQVNDLRGDSDLEQRIITSLSLFRQLVVVVRSAHLVLTLGISESHNAADRAAPPRNRASPLIALPRGVARTPRDLHGAVRHAPAASH